MSDEISIKYRKDPPTRKSRWTRTLASYVRRGKHQNLETQLVKKKKNRVSPNYGQLSLTRQAQISRASPRKTKKTLWLGVDACLEPMQLNDKQDQIGDTLKRKLVI